MNNRNNRKCVYEGKELTYAALVKRFTVAGKQHPGIEAAKYLKEKKQLTNWENNARKGSQLEDTQQQYYDSMKTVYYYQFLNKGNKAAADKTFFTAYKILQQLLTKLHDDEEVIAEILCYQFEKEKRRIIKLAENGIPIEQAIEAGITKALFADLRYSYMTCFQNSKKSKLGNTVSYEVLLPHFEYEEVEGWLIPNPEDKYIEQLAKEGY